MATVLTWLVICAILLLFGEGVVALIRWFKNRHNIESENEGGEGDK